MRRDPRTFLWDVREAAAAIRRFAAGRDFDAYEADLMFRSAVERQFEIVGEALNQLSRAEPQLAARIPGLREVVNFRNALIHGYNRIEDKVVWQAIEKDLPALQARVDELLRELGDPA
jgi:uncharacterized protein with HEPN domain